jgi:hypothetical protein
MKHWKYLWWTLIVVSLVCTGCDDEGETAEIQDAEEVDVDSGADVTEEIAVTNQTVELTTEIVVDSLSVRTDRLVVVTDSDSDVIGSTVVSSDSDSGVAVGLVRRLNDGENLVVRLHEDGGGDGVFASDEDDPPLSTVGEASFEVSVLDGTPDIRLVYQGGVPDFRVNVEPESFSDDIDGLFDPVITFRSGWRYEIDNRAFGSHQWEMVDTDGNKLLSQSDEGTLESDEDIVWEDSAGVSQFTVTASVRAQSSDYRCSIHPRSMIGAVEFVD